ncbi:MAG: small subunit ribosomal protein S1, partial [Rickettsiales bacterium]
KKDFLEVELDIGLKAIIKRLDVSKNKHEQKTEKFEVGDRLDAKVTLFNNITGKMLLSIKDMESDTQEAYIYSSDDAASGGSSLGAILGEALQESALSTEKTEAKTEAKAKAEAKAEDKK